MVVNPYTGKRIIVGGKIYKDLEKKGIVEKPGSIPSIQKFVYVPSQDIWIRRVGTKFESFLKHGYILDKKSDQLAKKTTLNTLTRVTTEKDTLAIGELLLKNRDVLWLILSYNCTHPTSYACYRLVCKRFKSIVDTNADISMLIDVVCERLLDVFSWVPREDGHRPPPKSRSTHAIFFSNRMNGNLPEKVAIEYIKKYPELLLERLDGSRAIEMCVKLAKRKDEVGLLLRDTILTWLHNSCVEFRRLNHGTEKWIKVRKLLLVVVLPVSIQNWVLPVVIMNPRTNIISRTLLEHQQLAKKKPINTRKSGS